MIIQVITGEVGEGSAGEFDAGDAVLIEGVRGNFHDAGPAAFVAHGGEELGDFGGAGSRHGGGAAGSAIVDVHRADQAAAALDVSEHVADEIGGGGFAVGAGDAQDMDFVAGRFEEGIGEEGGGGRDIFDHDLGKRRAGDGFGGDDGNCPTDVGVGDVLLAVGLGTTAGDEEVAWLNQTRVFADPAHFDVFDSG